MARSTAMKVFAALAISLGVMVWCQSSKPHNATRSQWTAFNPVTPLSAMTFFSPPSNDRPWVRMNMPSSADPEEIKAEIHDLHDKGIAGVELGQGAFPNNEQLVALLSKANELGIKVSLSHGPTQNPTGYSIDDDNARKTLALGDVAIDGGTTFDGPVPAARPPARPRFGPPPAAAAETSEHHRTTLIALFAYRCTASPCAATGPAELDPASVIDRSSTVSARNTEGVLGGTTVGNLRWTAPKSPIGTQWVLVSFWSRGVFAQPDPFSDEGLKQLILSMESDLTSQV